MNDHLLRNKGTTNDVRTASQAAQELPAILREVSRLKNNLANIQEAVKEMEAKLSIVLRPSGPNGQDTNEKGGDICPSPFNAQLSALNLDAEEVISHMRDIFYRLEV